MSKLLAIKAENISKQYRLGQVGTGTIVHDLNRWWASLRGKEDPYLKIGEVNDRTSKGNTDYVWSLKNINFEIEQGEAVGIIGRNGAGKSTLLKLLSKVTKPSTGNFKINGRIASLLEVGTGFNPEMTGRENIFLNGAILGMTRREIRNKFDEIVDFSGCERYIDTPVKRYSSGMYVRLAFAVAAYLESEILIVDEVLAVGDAEFQKKCLGKMGDVSKGQGRTVLFVSHNMAAVKQLCTKGIVLQNGEIMYNGGATEAVVQYQNRQIKNNAFLASEAVGNKNIQINKINILPINGSIINIDSGINVEIEFFNNITDVVLDVSFILMTQDEVEVLASSCILTPEKNSKKGFYTVKFQLPRNLLNAGIYYFKIIFGANAEDLLFYYDKYNFEILNEGINNNFNITPGIIRPEILFKTDYHE